MSLSDLIPNLSFHLYFKNKKMFELTHDCYVTWVMFIVESGTFRYTMNGKTELASDGEIVICPPDTVFYRKTITPLSFHFIRFDWQEPCIDKNQIPRGKITLSNTQRFSSTLALLRKLSHCNYEKAFELKCHLLHDIWLSYCFDLYYNIFENDVTTNDSLLEDALVYIKENVFKKLLISDIAHAVGLTHVQFIRRFKKEFNMNPNQYIICLRLDKAKKLLTETTLYFSKIAELCGFDNEYYFSNFFKKHIGMPPSAYRSANRISI